MMESLIGVAGVIIGVLLSEVTTWLTDRHLGRGLTSLGTTPGRY